MEAGSLKVSIQYILLIHAGVGYGASSWLWWHVYTTWVAVYIPNLTKSSPSSLLMTIPTVTVANLKKYKNAVIGNPVAKVQLVRDELFVTMWAQILSL